MGTMSTAALRQTAELLQRLIDSGLAGASGDSAAVEAAARRVLTRVPAPPVACFSALPSVCRTLQGQCLGHSLGHSRESVH